MGVGQGRKSTSRNITDIVTITLQAESTGVDLEVKTYLTFLEEAKSSNRWELFGDVFSKK